MSNTTTVTSGRSRWVAAALVAPFFALGIGEVLLLLFAGFNPLWAVVIVPPIGFMTVLGWLSFSTGFDER
jgi:hypothetical protein